MRLIHAENARALPSAPSKGETRAHLAAVLRGVLFLAVLASAFGLFAGAGRRAIDLSRVGPAANGLCAGYELPCAPAR